ncbi:MAG: calcium/sodium antiporter [Alistipes sp.]|nr:calcium/sodium antiporter [Alistipes sp.]
MEYIILIVSLLAIVWGADNLVNGSVAIARRFKISDFVIGAVIVGIGTSCPELVVSATGAFKGNVDVAIGNVVGSNIFNIFGILGITALLHPVKVSRENKRFDLPVCIFVSILALLMAFNFFNGNAISIGRLDGIILLLIFALFIYVSFLRDKRNSTISEEQIEDVRERLIISIAKVVLGLGVLVTGCHFFVEEAVVIATKWGVNEAFISITLIACGTSLPELAASLAAAAKKNTQLALGNVVGSNIFNITFILGVSSQISPLTGGGITLVDYLVMIAAAGVPLALGMRGKITRLAGLIMFICFASYSAYLIYAQNL